MKICVRFSNHPVPSHGASVHHNHIHTTYSFSPYSPTAAVYAARMEGLCTAGIIDHDSISNAFDVAHPALMVENNCVIVTGSNLLQAFDRLEVLESTAHSLINASSLGEIDRISDEEVEDLKKAFHLEDCPFKP